MANKHMIYPIHPDAGRLNKKEKCLAEWNRRIKKQNIQQ